ncbi:MULTISPECIES: hypothetical protein [unclassified Pseudomonas]|uniref:hypothetical protein n=1 Tax=unclassified Pseudomonas TaxID=196821 RepID=UPI0021C8EE12|nr:MULTISPECIES: hypothetical protein [unclassified Pseudomonas]MCU1735738.1 hypothetical protein [Pseudomonas sp. 20P_3.2_Bac4]MCU1744295.1 hypothetical protein [Pseudomonas sp. 20P_3.2_Bac5]
MPALRDDIRLYVGSLLNAEVQLKTASVAKLPFHIRDTYTLADLTLRLGSKSGPSLSMLLLLSREDAYPGAVTLRKHIQQVQKATDKVVVYACKSLSSADRRSLITHHLNFIQPGSQMFIPELAMDLREHVRKRRNEQEVSTLLPATQAMLLGRLYEGWDSDSLYTSSAIMGNFEYSRVTLSKVIDQLLALNIIEAAQRRGVTNVYSFTADPATVFKSTRQWMRSPVKRTIPIDRPLHISDGLFLAGETALASYTLLAGPAQPVYGMIRNTFDLMLKEKAFKVADSVDDVRAWVEIWSYRSLTIENEIADQASLLLSLEDSPDERVQIALDAIREEVAWLGSEG